jgi:hypothetical protein
VIHSVVGQNERWAQLTALQTPPAIPSGQGGGPALSNAGTAAPDPTAVSPVAASTASPLSSNTSLMLMLFGGGLDPAGSTVGNGSTIGSGSPTQTVGSPDETTGTVGGSGIASLLADLQSLMASLAGGASAATSTSASTPASGSTPAPAVSGPSSNGNSLFQNLDRIASDLGTIVASTGSTQRQTPPPGGAPSGGNDITNTISAAAIASWGDGPSGPGGGWQEQFALAAYESGSASGPNSQSAWQSLSV